LYVHVANQEVVMTLTRPAPLAAAAGLSDTPVPPRGTTSISVDGTATVVALRGEFDIGTVAALSDALWRACGTVEEKLVVDLAQMTFMDVSTVRALDQARRLLDDQGRRLAFRSPSKMARWMLGFFALADLIEASPTTVLRLGAGDDVNFDLTALEAGPTGAPAPQGAPADGVTRKGK
jgi:stage II sporulation protein AA (anti-sigma F factor antagonist)